MKKITLKEVKEMYNNEKCFETETSFIVNQFGKYMPNITLLIPKEYKSEDEMISLLRWIPIPELTDNMNVSFNGNSTNVLFGNFWISEKKGTHCFRVTPQSKANHILIRVFWGGNYNHTRGNYTGEEYNPLHFRHAPSNGGGRGYDYWVFPKNYRHKMSDSEWD